MPTKPAADKSTESADDNDTGIVFEDALQELEQLVARMESGDLSLNDSLQAFERGVKLARQCQVALDAAELKVQSLSADGELTPFDPDAD